MPSTRRTTALALSASFLAVAFTQTAGPAAAADTFGPFKSRALGALGTYAAAAPFIGPLPSAALTELDGSPVAPTPSPDPTDAADAQAAAVGGVCRVDGADRVCGADAGSVPVADRDPRRCHPAAGPGIVRRPAAR